MTDVLNCANCGGEIAPREPRLDDELLIVCDEAECLTRLRVVKNHGYPLHLCQHGRTPAYCAECITAGTAPPFVYKGTGNEWKNPPSQYIYIVPLPEKRELEDPEDPPESVEKIVATVAVPPSNSIEVLIAEPRAIKSQAAIPELCPHGGIILNGITYCGLCPTKNDGDVGFHLFYTDLVQICRQEAYKKYFYRVDPEDAAQHAFGVVWSELQKILNANTPKAMARTIAKRAINDLKKKAYNWETPVSDGFEPDSDQAGGAVDSSASYEGDDIDTNSWLDREAFEKENPFDRHFAVPWQVGGRDWDIPGGERFWIPPCYHKLENALQDAMAALPRPPHDKVPMAVSMMLKRWVGYFPEIGEQTYEDIGQECDPITNSRRVKYLIQKGLRQARERILRLTATRAIEEMQK